METLTIALALSILGTVISVTNFILSRKDKAIKDTKENHQELIEYQLNELKQDVKSIIAKLDRYYKEFDDRIDEKIDLHVKLYHKGE